MDNTKEFRSIELCAGYAGIHLGLKRVIQNLRTVVYVEIEAFADANLVTKMEAGHLDAAPIWTDLKTFNAKPFRDRIHLITGGYPCQPFSAAGKRLGADDPRHLWPYIYKIVKTIRPVFCFFENVEGHLSLGFKEVQQSLRDLGYRVESGIFSAAECGAPQQRKRLFILCKLADSGLDAGCPKLREQQEELPEEFQGGYQLANTGKSGPQGAGYSREKRGGKFTSYGPNRRNITQWPSRPGQEQHKWEPPRVVGDTSNSNGRGRECETETGIRTDGIGRGGSSEPNEREIKRPMGRDFDEPENRLDNAELHQSCDNRTDELRLLGNGVMPDVSEKAFITLFGKLS